MCLAHCPVQVWSSLTSLQEQCLCASSAGAHSVVVQPLARPAFQERDGKGASHQSTSVPVSWEQPLYFLWGCASDSGGGNDDSCFVEKNDK